MPRTPKLTPDPVGEALERIQEIRHLPTTRSLPSWAGSLSPRPVTREDLLTHVDSFDVVMGIPEYTIKLLPFWKRILRSEKFDFTPNNSYVQRNVLYLTPTDFNFFMAARKIKENSVTLTKDTPNAQE